MTTNDWLTDFNVECEKLKSEICDNGARQMVESRNNSNLIETFQEPIIKLAKDVEHIEAHLGRLETQFSQLSATVPGDSSSRGATSSTNSVDPATLERLKALEKSSKVNTRGTVIANIPALGTNLRPTPYLEDKKQDDKK